MATSTSTSCSGVRADEIRAKRLALDWTRADLARRAPCSIAHLANIEAGAIPRTSQVVMRIEAVLAAALDGSA